VTRKAVTVKQKLMPSWSVEEQQAGERLRQAWEQAFSAGEAADGVSASSALERPEVLKAAQIRSRHEAELLRYPNVIGIAEGLRTRRGQPTGEPCLVVYVERKIPRARLGKSEILPSDIEGVPVDVVEVGKVEPLPARPA
jgi:hypothetical protein